MKIILTVVLCIGLFIVERAMACPEGPYKARCEALKKVCPSIDAYRIVGNLGSGNNGDVYKVETPQGSMALKIFKHISIFVQEVEVMTKVSHMGQRHLMPSIGCLFPELRDGKEQAPGVFMPLMAGSLKELITQKYREGIPETLAIHILLGIAAGLRELELLGHIHCDLKPENILLDAANNVRISDLDVDRVGSPICSLRYRAPEWALPDRSSSDVRLYTQEAHIFSAGCVFFEVLTGRVLLVEDIKDLTTDSHLELIFQMAGSPSERNWPVGEARMRGCPHMDQVWRDQRFDVLARKGLPQKFLILVSSMLALDPAGRLSSQLIYDHLFVLAYGAPFF